MSTAIRVGQILEPSYGEKLKDDRWKTFSTNFRREQGNTCRICRRNDLETQVHHIFYAPDKEPWESYGDVILLCTPCHKAMHDEYNKFRRYVFAHLTPQTFRVLNGALAVALSKYDNLTFVHALSEIVSNPRLIENHARAWQGPK
jgi:hypothetical protein